MKFMCIKKSTTIVIALLFLGKFKMIELKKPRVFFRYLKSEIIFRLQFLQIWPVYFEVRFRDCDHSWGHRVRRYPCFAIGYFELLAEAYDFCEGPFSFYQVKKQDYNKYLGGAE